MASEDAGVNQFAENMRFCADLRFKQLGLLMAGMTLFGAGVAQYPDLHFTDSVSGRGLLSMGGMLFVGTMWMMEVRSLVLFYAMHEHAGDLWPLPILRWFSWFNSTLLLFLLHAAFYAFWFWCTLIWCPHWLPLTLGATGGVLLLLFTFMSYLPLYMYALKHAVRVEIRPAASHDKG